MQLTFSSDMFADFALDRVYSMQ